MVGGTTNSSKCLNEYSDDDDIHLDIFVGKRTYHSKSFPNQRGINNSGIRRGSKLSLYIYIFKQDIKSVR